MQDIQITIDGSRTDDRTAANGIDTLFAVTITEQ